MTRQLPHDSGTARVPSFKPHAPGAQGAGGGRPPGKTSQAPGRAVRSDGRPSRLWPATLVVITIGSMAHLVLFSGTAAMILQAWWEKDAHNYGFLIVPVSIYLLWRRRHVLARMAPEPTLWGLGIVAVAAFVWLLGNVAGVLVVEQFAFVLMLQAFLLGVVGWRVFRAALFPILYLLFAVPVGSFLTPPLQDLTAQFTVQALQLTGVPVYLDGLYIYIPSGTFKVAEACAGVRFLTTTVALGALVANLFYRQAWRRTVFMALAVAVPIVANGFRAYGLVMIAHLSDFQLAIGADHITFGFIFLSIVILVLLALGSTFRETWPVGPSTQETGSILAPAAMESPGKRALIGTAFGAVLIVAAAAAYGSVIENRALQAAVVELVPPPVGSDWRFAPDARSDWRPRFFGASAERSWVYVRGKQKVELYTAFYAHQRQDAEIVNWRNRLADGEVWREFTTVDRAEVLLDGGPLSVRRTYLRRAGRRRVVLFWYWIDGQFVANPYAAKLLEIKAKLLGGNQRAAVIAIATDYREIPGEAMRLLRAFLAETSSLHTMLEGAILRVGDKGAVARDVPCEGAVSCAG